VVVLGPIWMGAATRAWASGLWGAVGLLVAGRRFGVIPTSPPIDVMLIILAVIMAASVMDAAAASTSWCASPSGSSAPIRST
jgi:anaerobic C4-dicarboxylate transporter